MRSGHPSAERSWPRRVVTVPGMFLLAVLSVGLAPLWLPICAVADRLRPPPRALVRFGVMLTWLSLCEVAGLLRAGAVLATHVGRPEAAAPRLYALQRWWSGALFGGARRILGFRLIVEGQESAQDTPMLLFLRHASIADTLLPSALVANVFGTRLRYVMKRELLWDPCLDIVGQRVPNYFVDRASPEGKVEADAIARLGRDLGPGEGVVIYPEGTRHTPAKHARVIERFESVGDHVTAARARSMPRVLPPRFRGPLALLEAAPEADVVFCAHAGFEPVTRLSALWRGELIGLTVRVRLWRVPRAEIPETAGEQREWLWAEWARIDAWLAAQEAEPA